MAALGNNAEETGGVLQDPRGTAGRHPIGVLRAAIAVEVGGVRSDRRPSRQSQYCRLQSLRQGMHCCVQALKSGTLICGF